jgi:polygalacturonase
VEHRSFALNGSFTNTALTGGTPKKYSAHVLSNSTRRGFLASAAAVAMTRPTLSAQSAGGWGEMPTILAFIKAPIFPNRVFEIAKYGAKPGIDSSKAIADAIAACNRAGGGRVLVPPGIYETAAIHLLSNVELHLTAGATLLFLQDPARYLPLVPGRFEGVELMNYSAFIYANDAENIAVTGEGTLDGNADDKYWWPWKAEQESRKKLFEMGQNDVPLAERRFGERGFLRPNFIQPRNSRNVLIEGVTIVRSPMWEVAPYDCTNVIVRGVKVNSHGPNNDGCDPDSCRDVLVENCTFDTGDDCIAIKSGRDRDGRRVAKPTENVIIRNCVMKDGHGGVTIGSEMSGDVRNVFVENCQLSSPHLNQALRFKTNAMRGGTIEKVYFRDIKVGEVADAVVQVDFYYDTGAAGPERPVVRNIEISGLTAEKAKYALFMKGFANAPIRDVRLDDCSFGGVANENVIEHVEGLAMNQVSIRR